MKKTILLPILLLGLTLASCGSNSKAGTKADFKEYKYGEALPEQEALEVAFKAYSNANLVSSATLEETEYEEENNVKTETKSKMEVKISSEGFVRSTQKDETTIAQQGLSWKEKHEYAQQMATATSKVDDLDVYAMMVLETTDGVEELYSQLMDKAVLDEYLEHVSFSMMSTYFNGLISAQGLQVFKAKKGFEAVVSSIDEQHTAVEWDQGYKEKIEITKQQTRYVINADYQVTEMVYDEEYHTNRDAATGAWFDKVVVAEKTSGTAKAKYEAKASDAALSSELVAKGANSFLAADPAILVLRVKVDGDTVTPVGMATPDLDFAVRTGINSARIGCRVNLEPTATYNGFAFVVSAAVQNDVFHAAEGKVAAFVPAIAGTTTKDFTYAEQALTAIVFPEEMTPRSGLFSLEVTTAVDAVNVANPQFQPY